MDDGPWIYESPDNGRNVLRRKVMDDVKWVTIDGEWMRLEELTKIAKEQKQQERLRKEHPSLAEAYDTYRSLLALCRGEKSDGTH